VEIDQLINSNFGFTPLKEVWLGDCYPAHFYDHLPAAVQDAFYQITEWTQQDLFAFQLFLECRGIIVRRPVFNSIDQHLDHCDNLVKPPIVPRDNYLVLGQTLYSLHNQLPRDPWQEHMMHYQQAGYDVQQPVGQAINCLAPPSLVRVGQDLYIDHQSHRDVWGFVCEWMIDQSRHYRINVLETDGHSDGVFCPVAPGLIMSTHYKYDYSKSFPDWQVFHIPAPSNSAGSFEQWQTPSNEINCNRSFAQHILTHAQDWVGNYQETVFEVNALVIDRHNIVVTREHPALFAWLRDHEIEPHVFEFRCRNFWDGGWHCLTLDIERQDQMTDLFPHRGTPGVKWID
jgi:hypothetical protein